MLVHLVAGNLRFCKRRYSPVRFAFLRTVWRGITLCRYTRDRLRSAVADDSARVRLSDQIAAWARLLRALPVDTSGGNPPAADTQKRPSAEEQPNLRLLFLVPYPPRTDAAHGGSRVIAQVIMHLAGTHDVALVYLRTAEEPDLEDDLRDACARTECVSRPGAGTSVARRARWYVGLLSALARGTPMWVADWAVPRYAERVRRVVREWQPDIIQLENHIMGQYLSHLDGCPAPRIVVFHEPGTEAARDRWQAQRGVRRALLKRDWRCWEVFERGVLAAANVAVVFTERDRGSLEKLAGSTPLRVIAPGIADSQPLLNACGCEPAVLFVGSFRHPPNVDAAERLLGSIFPLVLQRRPDALAYVVGDGVPRSIRKAGDSRRVFFTGYVPDITPYLDRAAVVVAPLRLGGGIRVKVMEALAAGKAVIATRLAVEGLDLADGEQVILAESDREFADAIVGLLGDPIKRAGLASRARAWASAHLPWAVTIEAYEALYSELTGCSSVPARHSVRSAQAAGLI